MSTYSLVLRARTLVFVACLLDLAVAELEYYPGYRRPDERPTPKWFSGGVQDANTNNEHYALQRLASLLEEAHRRHVKQELERNHQQNQQHGAAPGVEYQQDLMDQDGEQGHLYRYRPGQDPSPYLMHGDDADKEKPSPMLQEQFEPLRKFDDEDKLKYQPSSLIHHGGEPANEEAAVRGHHQTKPEQAVAPNGMFSEQHHFHPPSTKHGVRKDVEEGPEFTFELAPEPLEDPSSSGKHSLGSLPFAVGPNDPRYYIEDGNGDALDEKKTEKADKDNDVKSSIVHESEPLPVVDVRSKITGANEEQRPGGLGGVEVRRHAVHRAGSGLGEEGPTLYVVAMIAGISAAATVCLVAFGIGWYTLQKRAKLAADVDYPAYGVTGPNKDGPPSGGFGGAGGLSSPGSGLGGDKRLAQSAQLYHYHHQKQQILAMENRLDPASCPAPGTISELDSDEENDEGDYTVYECPGLAPTGEMEVKNPMFLDDPTPATPASQTESKENTPQHHRAAHTQAANAAN